MFSLKKKSITPIVDTESKEIKERLFFHDVINQTHGLLLFLGHKDMSGEGLDSSEVKMIEKELKTLQSLLHDHYNFKHKNLIQVYDWVPFSYVKQSFATLCQTYLNHAVINTNFVINEQSGEESLIHYPSFYRILNNLVKNVSESQCQKVDFEFVLSESGLKIETKNQLKKNEAEATEYLTRVILDEKSSSPRGLGLDSIHHLAEVTGGTFSFEIFDNFWINRLFLPTKKLSALTKSDKNAA